MEQVNKEYDSGCLLCGKPLVYRDEAVMMECAVCHKSFLSNAACEGGHFVCDRCHSKLCPEYLELFLRSEEKDPMLLLEQAMALKGVHTNGPEHHALLPCALLTAYHNNGGDIDLPAALKEAMRRGGQVPGGFCGYQGNCGAAVGAGIYASLVLGSNPLKEGVWPLPMELSGNCLLSIAKLGGVRCCKRTCMLSVEEAVLWTEKYTGIKMEYHHPTCAYSVKNGECLYTDCPYFE